MVSYIGLRPKKRVIWCIGLVLYAMVLVPSSLSPALRPQIALVGADVEVSRTLELSEKLHARPAHSLLGDALTPHQASLYAPFVELGAMDSAPDEEMEAFLIRVAQTLDLFTRQTHHEACGVIMTNETQSAWRVRITTNRSHLSCVMVAFEEPGYVRMGGDIHSHPYIPDGTRANAQDVLRRRDFTCGENIRIFDQHFSQIDFDHGPGYLVSRGRLLHQHGEQWPVRLVAEFEEIDDTQSPNLERGGVNPVLNPELAAAAWKNEDIEGVPSTECPEIESVEPGTFAKSNLDHLGIV